MSGTVHVVGAGLAGLAAALAASSRGAPVRLYDAAPVAGGRCRSFFDPVLGRLIDNGAHLLLGANRKALAYLTASGGAAHLAPLPVQFPFVHLREGWRRTLRPGFPPAGIGETLAALGLPWIAEPARVAERLGHHRHFATLWQPLCLAILNTAPEHASARLFARVLRTVFLGGRRAAQPFAFPDGLSAALIDPALAAIRRRGGRVAFHHRLTAIRQSKLTFGPVEIDLTAQDRIILALPPAQARRILPGLPHFEMETIANAHFRLPDPPSPLPPTALLGGQGQWLFVRGDVASVTISAAAQRPDPAILWAEIAPLLGQPAAPLPPHRLIWEKQATLRHNSANLARRPSPLAAENGIILAGDWVKSPWPCTIEAAVSSGLAAARLALERDDLQFS